MPHEKIKAALEKLQTEIAQATSQTEMEHDALCTDDESSDADPELSELLSKIGNEIDAYLESSDKAASNKHGFAHRLEEIATDFSVEHPKLDAVLLEIRKILLSIGA